MWDNWWVGSRQIRFVFLGVMTLLASVLGCVAWWLIEQDRQLAAQRLGERRDAAADLAVAALETRNALVVPILALYTKSASSHHAFSPVYDEKRTITVVGVVTQFRFVNPHAMMFMDVADESGKVLKWAVEFAGRLNLSNVGWTQDSIKTGEKVTVTGNPTHTGSQRMFFRKLVHADGSELLPGDAQRLKSVEEERRQRALQRNQQK
jgi:Family of unknown function (DUF6152)